MTSIPKWRAWVTWWYYHLLLYFPKLHSDTHFFSNSNNEKHSPFTFGGGLFVVLSAVHQTYSITLRLRDHNRLSWITRLPYINMQWNVSCIKNTKIHICEDLLFLKCCTKIALKQLEITFHFGIFFELLNLKKLAFKMKIGCSTVSVQP